MLTLFRKRKLPTADRPEPTRAEVPELRGAEIAAIFYGHRIGGDYYDFLRVPGGRLLFVLLDVAGRRDDTCEILCAAQETFRTSGAELFREEDINEADAMIELCVRLNLSIIKAASGVRSCPGFLGCYNEALGTVCYANAGQTPGLLRDASGVTLLPATGLPLGLFSHATADAKIAALQPGAALLIVSRGIVDASCKGEEFGVERVKEGLQQIQPGSARELSSGILAKVQEYICAPPTHDDVTAISLIRAKAAAAEQNQA
jgi:serine phosphatase RsbU (regulator of sigma subunit)